MAGTVDQLTHQAVVFKAGEGHGLAVKQRLAAIVLKQGISDPKGIAMFIAKVGQQVQHDHHPSME
ncbi:hypothetical protein KAM471_29540 [Aeromonas caviae]|nr:hypothetical protein KAM471_29540 [Aeromonas caviae]